MGGVAGQVAGTAGLDTERLAPLEGQRLGEIIAGLQCLGLRGCASLPGRRGGAGPAEGGGLVVGGRAVSAPTSSPFVSRSPYHLEMAGDQPVLMYRGSPLVPVELVAPPGFYQGRTPEGVPYFRIALLHGRDCLATTLLQRCRHWHTPQRCRFCGIELSLQSGQTIARKSPEQLARVARAARESDGVRHLVLTTGTAGDRERELRELARAARAVKQAAGLAVHAQFMPPVGRRDLEMLRRAGVDTVGIHRESFDPRALARVAPAKAALGLGAYRRAWREAVEVFGPGQVSSFVIMGLGEDPAATVAGCEILAEMGVYPFLVPLRPIPGSLMQNQRPPAPEQAIAVYRKVAAILAANGLSARQCRAGCVRCGACSALPAFELPGPELVCHPARTRSERQGALEVRRQVFVEEQRLFEGADRDPDDPRSIHLVARSGERILGTVRVFPVADSLSHWVGGRLAVLPGHRTSGAGELLVRRAMLTVRKRGCRKFTATIQEANVPFFQRIGWWVIGEPFTYHGKVHLPMQADLQRA